jgi:hypothetical protein
MRFVSVAALVGALSIGSSAFAKDGCPKWEAGTRYPWQTNQIMPRDQFAHMLLKVDRHGYPLDCKLADNNYPDPESRVWLCKQYYLMWRGPQAAVSDPDTRVLERLSIIPGYDHYMADLKARRTWFREHPEARPECYPEPSRPDRMDL